MAGRAQACLAFCCGAKSFCLFYEKFRIFPQIHAIIKNNIPPLLLERVIQMKLKTRLSISFCIIIFVPILLAAFVIFGFQKFHMRAIEQTYGIETGDYK